VNTETLVTTVTGGANGAVPLADAQAFAAYPGSTTFNGGLLLAVQVFQCLFAQVQFLGWFLFHEMFFLCQKKICHQPHGAWVMAACLTGLSGAGGTTATTAPASATGAMEGSTVEMAAYFGNVGSLYSPHNLGRLLHIG
jgi:hypothetical protein